MNMRYGRKNWLEVESYKLQVGNELHGLHGRSSRRAEDSLALVALTWRVEDSVAYPRLIWKVFDGK
jgi:hypothetical protein